MPAYWIGSARVRDPEGLQRYAELARLAGSEHPSRLLAGGGRFEVLEGGAACDRYVVREFPTMQAALALYRSAAYQRAAQLRRAATEEGRLVIVEGV
jgi:uncharacterized protein (DUF1330 family)